MNENVILRKKRKDLLELNLAQPELFSVKDFEAVIAKLNKNLEWLQKMETVMEMEESYKSGELPQGYTFNPELSGLNNPANR
jgi:Zn-finger domain-containing protein